MIGETVGNFTIVARLGAGGMGEVFLGENRNSDLKVAIKTLLANVSENKEQVQRFFNEAKATNSIRHSGIVKIFDTGFLPNGRAYLVMEFLDGETLGSRIRRSGRLSLAQIGDLGRQISSVLEATHAAGITHRDLKPDNVFLVPDAELDSGERVKILDFGIAKLGGTGLTGTGAMGTPDYMAPEQWQNAKNVDWRADAYSLGCLAFEMATGRVPFPAESIAGACTQHLTAPPPRARELLPSLPAELDTLIVRLLAKSRDERPASMKEITRVFAGVGAAHPRPFDTTAALPPRSLGFAATMAPPAPAPAPPAPPPPTQVPRPADTTLGGASGVAMSQPAPASNKALMWGLGGLGVVLAGLIVALVVFLQRDHGGDAAPAAEVDSTPRAAHAPLADAASQVASAAAQDASPSPQAPPADAPPATQAALSLDLTDDGKSETLPMSKVYDVYSKRAQQLGGCLSSTGVSHAKIAIIIGGPNGKVSFVKVNGETSGPLWTCINGVLRALQFPPIHGARTRAEFEIDASPDKKPASSPPPPPAPTGKQPPVGLDCDPSHYLHGLPAECPPPPKSQSQPSGKCDEVDCVINNYQDPCCARFRKNGPQPPPPQHPASNEPPETLDRAAIVAGIAKIKGAAQACGEKSSAKGSVRVGVTVSPSGQVSDVVVKQAPDDVLGSCVAAAVRRATFPKSKNGITFTYPFVF